MFQLLTERLRLIPLDEENFKLYIECREKLEIKLGLNQTNSILEGHVRKAMEFRFDKVIRNKEISKKTWYFCIILKNESSKAKGKISRCP